MDKKILTSVLLVALLGAGALYIGFQQPATAPQTQAPTAAVKPPKPIQRQTPASAPSPALQPAQPEPALIQPPAQLADSDDFWQSVVAELAPGLLEWLAGEEQIRKWVMLVDQIADADLSNKYLPINYPMAAFEQDRGRVSEKNYTRANALVDAFTNIDPQTLVRYYRLWQPLFERAYGELGKPGDFDARVMQAIRQIQNVPAQPVAAAIEAKPVMYKYVDARYEKAPALHKWMWRLGPENQSRIKTYLTQVKLALYRQQGN